MPDKKNRLGLFSMTLLGVNAMIGTGIYLLPSKPMALVGPSSILVYALVTVIVLSIALCFAECASFFSRNGAAYLYAKEAFGDFVGYQVGILKWLVSIISWAAVSVGFVMILGEMWPAAMTDPYRTLLIVTLVGGLGALNALGLKHIKLLNNIVAITKLTPLFLFIALGLFCMHAENFAPFVSTDFAFGRIGEASLVIFFAFTGFETLAIAAEDMHNPQKNIPIAIMLVLAISAFIYFLIQLVVVGVLGPELASSVAPIADAAYQFFGDYGRLFILLSTLVSSIGINIAASFTTPRIVEVLAQDKMLPAYLAKQNSNDAPSGAIIVSVILTLVAALSGSFIKLVTISVIARLLQYIPTCLAVFILRKKHGTKAMFFPESLRFAIPILGVAFSIWLLSNASYDELVWGSSAILLSIPFYFWMSKARQAVLQE